MRFSELAARSTAKEKISSLLLRAGIRSSAVAAISADCSQQGTRKEVTLETHAQVLQASVELRSAAQRSRTGARGPLDSPLQERLRAPERTPTRTGAGEGSFSLGDSIEMGVPGREGSKGERPWRGQSSARRTKRCEAILYATCTRAWDRERGQACTVILMSCPNSSRKRISRSREKPERRPRRRAETLG